MRDRPVVPGGLAPQAIVPRCLAQAALLGLPGWGAHLEAAEGHVDLAAALVGAVEHLQQAIGIHHPRPLAPPPPRGKGACGIGAPAPGAGREREAERGSGEGRLGGDLRARADVGVPGAR